jgi:hypothetical protein
MKVRVMYGWACKLPMDDRWKPQTIPLSQLVDFIHESERRGVFIAGNSDLYIYDNPETTYFLLCHEADVHFVTPDRSRLTRVIEAWKARGLRLHVTEYESHYPNREWMEV